MIKLNKIEIMKVIKINTPDGQYTLPLIKVAEHRASEYHSDELSNDFKEECEYVLNETMRELIG